MEFPEIEVAPYEYPETREAVEYIYPELTAVCPQTGLPDYYILRIVYEPDKKLPELKSLKMYLIAYRNYGIWHEHLANKILEDFRRAVEPRWVYVELYVNNRGGIYTIVRRFWSREKGDSIEEALKRAKVHPHLKF